MTVLTVPERGEKLYKVAADIVAGYGVQNEWGQMASKGQYAIQRQYYGGEWHCRIYDQRTLAGLSVSVSPSGVVECNYPALLDSAEKVVADW